MGGPSPQETFYNANEEFEGDGNDSSSTHSQPVVVGEAAEEHVAIEIVGLVAHSIEKKIEITPLSRAWEQCCIYRVHEKFHKMREHSAYMPEVVSIGPFHCKTEGLKAMEECKLLYMHTLLFRTAQKKFKLEDHVGHQHQKMEEVVLSIQKKLKMKELVRKYSSEVSVTTGGSASTTNLGERVEPITEIIEEFTSESNIRPSISTLQEEEAATASIKLNSSESIVTAGGTWLTVLKDCVASIKMIEAEARECYSEPINLRSEEFVEMMVVDGLFIIELFQRCAMKHSNVRNDPLFGKICVLSSLTRDLLLLENQIPMIVLERLFDYTVLDDKLAGKSLNMIILGFFNHLMPRDEDVLDKRSKCEGTNHLLHLLAKTFHPPRDKNKAQSSWMKVTQSVTKLKHTVANKLTKGYTSWKVFFRSALLKLKHAGVIQLGLKSADTHNPPSARKKNIQSSWKFIPTVTELKRAGVMFKKSSTEGSFLDIKFNSDDGVLTIPTIIVQDKTDLLLRNLIASEQFSDGRVTYMTSYAFFMDSLINSSHDVELLRNQGIIINYLGSDEDISNLFNKLCCEIIIGNFFYSQICDRLNNYYKQRRHRWQATLKRDYCNSPCAIISFFAASLLIALTLTGSLFALLSFVIHKS